MVLENQKHAAREMFALLIPFTADQTLSWISEQIELGRKSGESATTIYSEVVGKVVHSERVAEALVHLVETDPAVVCELAVASELMTKDKFRVLFAQEPSERSLEEFVNIHAREEKYRVFSEMVADQPVLLHLDPRKTGVKVPSSFGTQDRLVLRFGHELMPPCDNFMYNARGVEATLSFGGQPFHCEIPWDAVFILVGSQDGDMKVWSESAPRDLQVEKVEEPESMQAPLPQHIPPTTKDTHVPHLKLVE